MGTSPVGGARRSVAILLVAVALLGLAEISVRAREKALPERQVWPSLQMQAKEQQIHEIGSRGGASVIFLGSSAVNASVDPSALKNDSEDRPAFNAAVGGATTMFTRTWGERLAYPVLRPDTVIVGYIASELNDLVRWDLRDQQFATWPAVQRLTGTESLIVQAERHLEASSALFKYRTVIRQPEMYAPFFGIGVAPPPKGAKHFPAPDGQSLAYIDARPAFPDIPNRPSKYVVGGRQLQAVRDLVAFLKPRTKRVIVISMPVPENHVRLLPEGRRGFERFERSLEQAAKTGGAEYVKGGTWPAKFFADQVHVNGEGSKRVTSMMDDIIAGTPTDR